MANHKSALKRAKQNTIKQMRNRSYKTRLRNMVKKVNQAVEAQSVDEAKTILVETQSIIDKCASKGVIHKNTASRKISRLAKKVEALAG
ncbi:30S ribosomal protein S20 [Desulfatibacillum aliphaticivorans]|uniref:Small ribosomal subunit protein bS20 n=1 Tax=Desulfatibacillum aliphaticivorans TaxID=218208 RepID=RS20_DESAL|nr:30S ribosomal protein S20 [Desulfatibacillum aliphaticivorans]B8F9F2.1 RecName: Full=Small ribosomal subunit protein bS20; AltName: Full=30S ribosomal protein S20 [Desulfatibacillum aliphaticivorans]ACL02898.1 ribosomal protein S20 [Desulfatibacillum aliphaticivorans]